MSYRRGKVRKSSMPTQEIQNQNSKNLRREGEKGILIKRNDQRNNMRKYPVTEEHVSVEFLVQWMKRDRHQSSWSDFRTPETEVRASREKAETTFKKRELQTQVARRVEQCLYYSKRKCLALSYLPTQTINWMWLNKYLSDKQVLKKSPSKTDLLYQMSKYSEKGKNFQKMVKRVMRRIPEWQICGGPGEQSMSLEQKQGSQQATWYVCLCWYVFHLSESLIFKN